MCECVLVVDSSDLLCSECKKELNEWIDFQESRFSSQKWLENIQIVNADEEKKYA